MTTCTFKWSFWLYISVFGAEFESSHKLNYSQIISGRYHAPAAEESNLIVVFIVLTWDRPRQKKKVSYPLWLIFVLSPLLRPRSARGAAWSWAIRPLAASQTFLTASPRSVWGSSPDSWALSNMIPAQRCRLPLTLCVCVCIHSVCVCTCVCLCAIHKRVLDTRGATFTRFSLRNRLQSEGIELFSEKYQFYCVFYVFFMYFYRITVEIEKYQAAPSMLWCCNLRKVSPSPVIPDIRSHWFPVSRMGDVLVCVCDNQLHRARW